MSWNRSLLIQFIALQLAAASALLSSAAAAESSAPESSDPLFSPNGGIQFDLGVGFAAPFGELRPGLPMTDLVPWTIPIDIGLGYRWPYVSLMLVVPMAPGPVAEGNPCSSSNSECSIFWQRFALQVQVHPLTQGLFQPTLALDGGWQLFSEEIEETGQVINEKGSISLNGPAFAARINAYFHAYSGVRVGPYVAYTFGILRKLVTEGFSTVATGDVPNPQIHSWLSVGVGVELFGIP